MSTIDKIHRQAQRLPEPQQKEILDFIEFLLSKANGQDSRQADLEWSRNSIAAAMHGIDNEDSPLYHESDFKEKWK